jgi:hypothetical protein
MRESDMNLKNLIIRTWYRLPWPIPANNVGIGSWRRVGVDRRSVV